MVNHFTRREDPLTKKQIVLLKRMNDYNIRFVKEKFEAQASTGYILPAA